MRQSPDFCISGFEGYSYLGSKVGGFLSRIVLDVRCNETTSEFFHTDVFHVEANVVTGDGFCKI